MSGSFAAEVRARARMAAAALEAARRDDDVDALMLAEGEWEEVLQLANVHGVRLDPDGAEPGPGAAT
ncbi:hypothetical protein OHA25_44275 [Nonomuraea sp. NBC_00507]|uniref:hypothetical protein n=1 Tax=Nonomuraea sp. NBC_00507 TaxID=2976002 RepID=UPI002E17E078